TATSEPPTLSLHDALPILWARRQAAERERTELLALAGNRRALAAGGGQWADDYGKEADRLTRRAAGGPGAVVAECDRELAALGRSEEHTSELQSPYDLVCR